MGTPQLPSRYTLLETIGQGGEGRVFRVHDNLRGSELALKLTQPSSGHWLRREFDTLKQIHHENLVRVLDWGFAETGEVFYTMELVVGGDWGVRMGRPQPPAETRRIVTGVLRGLAHLHSHGEIHGDLKPGNVLLGSDGSVKVTDVGMGASTKGDLLSGTPGYSAPELWSGAPPDARSDIYSVGVMAYEALAGRHPFIGKTVREVVSGQLEGWVPSPAVHGAQLPADLEREIMRAIERDPALRPASADEFMEGLGESHRTAGILGGRFVARAAQLGECEALLDSEDPARPTLVWIEGEEGVGKSALVDEVASRATGRGIRVTELIDLTQVGSFMSQHRPTFAETERIWGELKSQPSVFVLDAPVDFSPAAMEALRTLARYFHAIAIERHERSPAFFVCEIHQKQVSAGRSERTISIPPLSHEDVAAFLKGYLGTLSVQPEVTRWLTSVTGGVPGYLAAVVHELIRQGFLRRNQGRWRFAESEAFPSIERVLHRGKWSQSFERLNAEEQMVVATLAIMPHGLPAEVLTEVIGKRTTLDGLLAKGWLRKVSGRLVLASGEIRRVAGEGSARGLTVSIEQLVLDHEADRLTRDERALLLVRNRPTIEALEEGLWSTRSARERGDPRTAVERAMACIDLAHRLGDVPRLERARLLAAQALHLLGRYDEASGQLEESSGSAATEQLLGLIHRSRGDLDSARVHLTNAIALAQEAGDSTVFLQGNAELAEVEWRHGDQRARDLAVKRLKDALSGEVGAQGGVDDRAALIYQLGAALVTTGRRDEGKEVLERGLALSPSDYWRMRIANGLGAAEYYLGRFENALEWMDEAWRMAERGGFDSFKARVFSGRAGVHYGLGKFREAVEYHRLSSVWATRSGEQFEYMAACSGESACQIVLGDYERALECAREARRVAGEISNEYEVLKNLEGEGSCLALIGDYNKAKEIAETLIRESGEFGKSAVAPRALLLAGTLARIEGNWKEAVGHLEAAEMMLLEERDWEDLPFVQIELRLVRAREDALGSVSELARIVLEGSNSGALTVQLRGAVALGEILLADSLDYGQYRELLVAALGRAGEAGASEDEWRLHHILAEICLRDGDRKGAATRLAQAVRVFRVIADRLSPDHRSCYLRTRHAGSLLSRAS